MRESIKKACKYYIFGGYSLDVFRLYADAVTAENTRLLKTLCQVIMVLCVIVVIPLYVVQEMRRLVPAVFVLLGVCAFSWFVGQWQSIEKKRWPSNGAYIIGISFCVMMIHINFILQNHNIIAFFCGMQLLMCVYILDYPLRLTLVNLILSAGFFLGCVFSPNVHYIASDGLTIAIFYVVNQAVMLSFTHNRLSQIISREELVNQRDTESLTRLATRSSAEKRITASLQTATGEPVMMLFDLDHFKELNDQMGHQMGDQALKEVAWILQGMFRSTDVLCRLGGDEFLVYLRDVPSRTWAEERAEQVVKAIDRFMTDSSGKSLRVTASLGVAYGQDAEMSFTHLYRKADEAMYLAKHCGGNCIRVWHKEEKNHEQKPVAGD